MPLGHSDCWKKVGWVRTKSSDCTTPCVLALVWRLMGELELPVQGKHVTAKWHQEQMYIVRGSQRNVPLSGLINPALTLSRR